MKPADLLARAAVDAADVALVEPTHKVDTQEQVLMVWLCGFRDALELAQLKRESVLDKLGHDGMSVVFPHDLEELDALALAARDSL